MHRTEKHKELLESLLLSLFSSFTYFLLFFKFLALEVKGPMDEVLIWFLALGILFLTMGVLSSSLFYLPVGMFNMIFFMYHAYYSEYFIFIAYVGFLIENYSWYSSIQILQKYSVLLAQ